MPLSYLTMTFLTLIDSIASITDTDSLITVLTGDFTTDTTIHSGTTHFTILLDGTLGIMIVTTIRRIILTIITVLIDTTTGTDITIILMRIHTSMSIIELQIEVME